MQASSFAAVRTNDPGNANLAVHVLLEEAGWEHEFILVDRSRSAPWLTSWDITSGPRSLSVTSASRAASITPDAPDVAVPALAPASTTPNANEIVAKILPDAPSSCRCIWASPDPRVRSERGGRSLERFL